MANAGVETSRICDVVRNSKIRLDIPLKPDLGFDSFLPEPNRYSDRLRHDYYSKTQLVDGVFPHVAVAEVGGCYHQRGTTRERNRNWFRKILPTYIGSPFIEDIWDWSDAIEDYFEEMKPPERLRCKIAAYTLDGAAEQWWQQLQHRRFLKGKLKISSWLTMKYFILNDFWPTMPSTKFSSRGNRNEHNLSSVCKVTDETYNCPMYTQPVKCSRKVSIEPVRSKPGRKDDDESLCASRMSAYEIHHYLGPNRAVHFDTCMDSECEEPSSNVAITEEFEFGDATPEQPSQQEVSQLTILNAQTVDDHKSSECDERPAAVQVGFVKDHERDDDKEKESNNGTSKVIEPESIKVPYAACQLPVSVKSMKEMAPTTVSIKHDVNTLEPLAVIESDSYQQLSGNESEQAYSRMLLLLFDPGGNTYLLINWSFKKSQLYCSVRLTGSISGTTIFTLRPNGIIGNIFAHILDNPTVEFGKIICDQLDDDIIEEQVVEVEHEASVPIMVLNNGSHTGNNFSAPNDVLRLGTYDVHFLVEEMLMCDFDLGDNAIAARLWNESEVPLQNIEHWELRYSLTRPGNLMYSIDFSPYDKVRESLIEACWTRGAHFMLLQHFPKVHMPITFPFDPGGRPCSLETWGIPAFIVYADSFVLNVTIDTKCDERRELGGVTSNIILVFGFLTNELECDLCNHTVYSILIAGLTYEGLNLGHDSLSSFVPTRVGFSGVLPCGNLNILEFDEIDYVVAEHGLQPLNVGIISHILIPFDPGGIACFLIPWMSEFCGPVLIELESKYGKKYLMPDEKNRNVALGITSLLAKEIRGVGEDLLSREGSFHRAFCDPFGILTSILRPFTITVSTVVALPSTLLLVLLKCCIIEDVWKLCYRSDGVKKAIYTTLLVDHFLKCGSYFPGTKSIIDIGFVSSKELFFGSTKEVAVLMVFQIPSKLENETTYNLATWLEKPMIFIIFFLDVIQMDTGPIRNDENNSNTFIMARQNVVTFFLCLSIVGKNVQSKRILKLFRKMVNGLDPPMDLDGELGRPRCGVHVLLPRGSTSMPMKWNSSADWQLSKTFNVAELSHFQALMMQLATKCNSRTSLSFGERMEMM